MEELGAFLDDVDVTPIVRAGARDAAGLLGTRLREAGRRYPWQRVVPDWIRTMFERMRDLADPTPADLRMVAAGAQRAARDWVPLHELETLCDIVVTCALRRLWESIEAKMCGPLLAVGAWAAGALRTVLATLRRAYFDEMCRLGGGRTGEMVISALLDGGDAASVAGVVGARLPEPCGVLVVAPAAEPGAVPFHFDRLARGPEAVLAGATAGLFAPAPGGERLVALVPVSSADYAVAGPRLRQIAEQVTEACERSYGRPFVAGLGLAARTGAARAAADEATGVADLLVRAGRPLPAALVEDVVLEMLLDERPDLASRLQDRAAGLWDRPELPETIRQLYHGGLDRGRTARRLGIHRSTLDHRLSRVERLTAVSPTSARGIIVLTAALAARNLAMERSPARVAVAPRRAG